MTDPTDNPTDKAAPSIKAIPTNNHDNSRSTLDSRTLDSSTPDSSTVHHAYPIAAERTSNQTAKFVLLALTTLIMGLLLGRYWGLKTATPATTADVVTTDAGDTKPGNEEAVLSTQKPVLTVEIVTPAPTTIAADLSAEGTISPKDTATVNGRVSGVAIEEVRVEEGDSVKKGQVLAVFDTDAMQQRLIQAQAELAEAETSFELAKTDAERVRPLLDINAISQQEADRYQATANQAAASAAASQARLNNELINMENAKVTAPVDGVISSKNADIGSVPGQAPLFTIIKNGQLEWQAQIDPNELGAVNVGTPVEVALPNNHSAKGKVSRIAPTAEAGSRQITVYALLTPSPYARAGMYQPGVFKLGSKSQLTIPVSAVITEDGYDYVMQVKAVKDENRDTVYRVHRTKVVLGERSGDRVVLLEPLSGEGNIVRQGGSFLSDGDIVRIAEAE